CCVRPWGHLSKAAPPAAALGQSAPGGAETNIGTGVAPPLDSAHTDCQTHDRHVTMGLPGTTPGRVCAGRLRASPRGGNMPPLRSRTVTHGRNMAGARALLRATGVAREDIGKPIVAVANSFTEFVPGHVHLREVGQVVAEAVHAAGAIPREFNTIAVDDGIAMGHGGMLYSLPSRELIADSVESMVNAHCADAMVCISNS